MNVKSLSNEELAAQAAACQLKIDELLAQIRPLQKEANDFQAQLKLLQEEQDTRKVSDSASSPDWAFLLRETGFGTSAKYKAMTEALAKLAKEGYHQGISHSGYFPEQEQVCIQVSLIRGNGMLTESVYRGLQVLLPHLKRFKTKDSDEHETCVLKVFEASLSANGSYHLRISPEQGIFHLTNSRYTRTTIVHSAASLKKLLEYVEKHHPYGPDDESE